MLGFKVLLLAGKTRETYSVTTGGSGLVPNRRRGFLKSSFGSIAPANSPILFPGVAIGGLYWDENGGAGADRLEFILNATLPNSGWERLTIGSYTFLRANATFVSSTNTSWDWDNLGLASSTLFGALLSSNPVVLSY